MIIVQFIDYLSRLLRLHIFLERIRSKLPLLEIFIDPFSTALSYIHRLCTITYIFTHSIFVSTTICSDLNHNTKFVLR